MKQTVTLLAVSTYGHLAVALYQLDTVDEEGKTTKKEVAASLRRSTPVLVNGETSGLFPVSDLPALHTLLNRAIEQLISDVDMSSAPVEEK
jgi:hypothetical protein